MDSCGKCKWYHCGKCPGDYRVGGLLWCTLFVEDLEDE